MVFTSLNFLIFFPIVTVLYFITPKKYRWITLLVSSYFFYINVKPVYVLLVSSITLSTYFFARLIDNTNIESKKKSYMVVNIVLILVPLFFFKYFSVINNGILTLLETHNLRWPLPEIKFILPIGISFYTFMAIGYTIDVYNEEIKSEKNIGILALFVSFFPVILSGPIERAKNMLPQFNAPRNFDYSMVVQGIKLMLWGYFMKLVLADRVGIYIDAVFNNIEQHSGITLLLATLLNPIRVYGDLGGYSLIAIGCANIMGINVIPNFNRPFFAISMSEFWRRWHMSLITWLTDYIYTPLSFSLRKLRIWGIVIALMLTFFISGVWHGAALTFVIWGIFQGVLLSIEALINYYKKIFGIKNNLNLKWWFILIGCVCTYLLFAFSLLIGGALDSISQAFYAFKKIFTDTPHLPYKDGVTMLYSFIAFCILFMKDFRDEFYPTGFHLFENKRLVIRWLSYYILIFIILFFGVFSGEQFIYYRF